MIAFIIAALVIAFLFFLVLCVVALHIGFEMGKLFGNVWDVKEGDKNLPKN